jgi:hypothetical protein
MAEAGGILVIEAGEVDSFRWNDDTPLVQLPMFRSPRSIQENLHLSTF